MRPARVALQAPDDSRGLNKLRRVGEASFEPSGAARYDAKTRFRRRFIAIRGGPDAIVLAFSWASGTVRAKILAAGQATNEDIEHATEAARGHAAVDDDPTEFYAMVKGHPVLGKMARETDVRIGRTPTVFESLAVSIIEQLVTSYEARMGIRRLWRDAGLPVIGTNLVAAPTPQAVARVPMWRLREIGIGARRAVTLHTAAKRGAAIERLKRFGPEVFLEKLQSLGGIGPWTANAVARNALGWADAVPVGDFHAPFTISAALGGYDLSLDERDAADDAMLEVLEPFRPHRARVAILFEGATVKGKWRPPRVDRHRREPWRY